MGITANMTKAPSLQKNQKTENNNNGGLNPSILEKDLKKENLKKGE